MAYSQWRIAEVIRHKGSWTQSEIGTQRMSQGYQKSIEEMRDILATAKSIAVVGISDRADRPSYGVAAYLKGQGYRMIPVNPTLAGQEVLGEKVYASLQEIGEAVDIVDIFRRSQDVPPVVEDAIATHAKVVWMQQGIVNEEAAARAEAAGLTVVMDACTAAIHRHLSAMGQI